MEILSNRSSEAYILCYFLVQLLFEDSGEKFMIENTYREVTQNIEVEVIPIFVPDQAQFANQFLYTYNISITNNSDKGCKLIGRHWIIIDGDGNREDIQGEGVVGEQPFLEPGENYQYSSYCPLNTPTGNMRGSFFFLDEDRNEFEVKVPLFFLRKDTVMQ